MTNLETRELWVRNLDVLGIAVEDTAVTDTVLYAVGGHPSVFFSLLAELAERAVRTGSRLLTVEDTVEAWQSIRFRHSAGELLLGDLAGEPFLRLVLASLILAGGPAVREQVQLEDAVAWCAEFGFDVPAQDLASGLTLLREVALVERVGDGWSLVRSGLAEIVLTAVGDPFAYADIAIHELPT